MSQQSDLKLLFEILLCIWNGMKLVLRAVFAFSLACFAVLLLGYSFYCLFGTSIGECVEMQLLSFLAGSLSLATFNESNFPEWMGDTFWFHGIGFHTFAGLPLMFYVMYLIWFEAPTQQNWLQVGFVVFYLIDDYEEMFRLVWQFAKEEQIELVWSK